MKGTTRNEALHAQVKGYDRNVMLQAARRARVVADAATLSKLIVGQMAKTQTTTTGTESRHLRYFENLLRQQPGELTPRLNHRATGVHVSRAAAAALPPGAKRQRTR